MDINPQPSGSNSVPADDSKAAADLIREKVSRIYDEEPNARLEAAEAQGAPVRSKHQQYMYELSTSGKDLATVQTEWHAYYQSLPPHEKHQVWHEFYESQTHSQPGGFQTAPSAPQPPAGPTAPAEPAAPAPRANPQTVAKHKHEAATPKRQKTATRTQKKPTRKLKDARSKAELQSAIREKVTAGGKLETKHHVQSLLFGLGMGAVVVIIFLFGFFNEIILAPFIQPSRVQAATPLIVSSDSVSPTAQPEVIIPKINVEIPTDFSQTTTDESQIENALENGVVHYPTTVLPGQNGNTAFFGHSSNNIFNKGKYKFAFVLLHSLQNGDTFYLTYNQKVYVYKVIDKKVVDPSEVSVLDSVPGQTATATLITCDPPGTSLHRLVIVGQQISPDPTTNTAPAAATTAANTSTGLPGNGPTLGGRLLSTAAGKVGLALVVLGGGLLLVRRVFGRTSRYA
jgi:LPXTG-site transpeptidase (sortase) family protein